MNWEIQPEGLTRLLTRMNDEYCAAAGTEIYVARTATTITDMLVKKGKGETVLEL